MRKPHRVSDERLAEEVAALDAYLASVTLDRRFAMFAMGARTAIEWARDSRRADPMNPMRLLSLTEFALDLPRVVPFTLPSTRKVEP